MKESHFSEVAYEMLMTALAEGDAVADAVMLLMRRRLESMLDSSHARRLLLAIAV